MSTCLLSGYKGYPVVQHRVEPSTSRGSILFSTVRVLGACGPDVDPGHSVDRLRTAFCDVLRRTRNPPVSQLGCQGLWI